MNIDAYNLDSLCALVRKMEKENQNLKQKLNEANIPYNSENIFVESSEENAEYDLDQGGKSEILLILQWFNKQILSRT